MISQTQFGTQAMTSIKQAMPENPKYDGPGGLEIPGTQNEFAANSYKPLPKPGVGA
jgi:hypothetical protein